MSVKERDPVRHEPSDGRDAVPSATPNQVTPAHLHGGHDVASRTGGAAERLVGPYPARSAPPGRGDPLFAVGLRGDKTVPRAPFRSPRTTPVRGRAESRPPLRMGKSRLREETGWPEGHRLWHAVPMPRCTLAVLTTCPVGAEKAQVCGQQFSSCQPAARTPWESPAPGPAHRPARTAAPPLAPPHGPRWQPTAGAPHPPMQMWEVIFFRKVSSRSSA